MEILTVEETLNASGLDEDGRIGGIERVLGYWELVVAALGAPANAVLLYLTVKFLRRGWKGPITAGLAAHRHRSNLVFIFSLTLADLLFTSVHCPMAFAEYTLRVKYSWMGCFARYVLTNTCIVSSSLSLLALNLDKFLYLHQPLRYPCLVTDGRAVGGVLLAWTVGVLWSLFFTLGPFTTYIPPCTFRPTYIYLYISFALVFSVLPTAVCLLVSVYIALVLVRVSRVRRRQPNARTLLFVFTTTVWTAITYLPYRIAYLIYISPVFPASRPTWLMRLIYFLVGLLASNPLGNPIITLLTQPQYSASLPFSLHHRRT